MRGWRATWASSLDWAPADGVAALAARLPERIPAGSTAKLAAIARGHVPPGADVDDLARWEHGCTYRSLALSLDRGDVRALCAVSATHSGVPSRGYARLHGPGRVVEVFAGWTGVRIT